MKKLLLLSILGLGILTSANANQDKLNDPATPLFLKCVSCHGVSGEKPALGKSKIINQLTKEEIVVALTGYKDGTYGGAMKSVMKAHVATLTPDEIEALSVYITNLAPKEATLTETETETEK